MAKKQWYDAMDEANDLVKRDVEVDIQGYDIDGDVIKAARENAADGRCGSFDSFSAAAR